MKNYILATIFLISSIPAMAYNRGYNSVIASEYVDARVVHVRPNIIQSCYNEPSRSYGSVEQPPRSRTAPVLGAIVGGALGNQIGGGSGRDAATVAGAALGYSITRDSQERNRYNNSQYGGYSHGRQRCEERVDGYNVVFVLNGREYQTFMSHNPGRTIRLRAEYSLQ